MAVLFACASLYNCALFTGTIPNHYNKCLIPWLRRGRGGYEQRVGLVWLESYEDAATFPAQVIYCLGGGSLFLMSNG